MRLLGQGLVAFFREATTYIHPDEKAKLLAGEHAARHVNYHRRIVWVSCMFAAIAGVTTLVFDLLYGPGTLAKDDHPRTLELVIFAPFVATAGALMFGVATTCAIAPREFLLGPIGQKWMKLIGARTLLGARLVCAAIALIFVGLLAGAAIAQTLAGK